MFRKHLCCYNVDDLSVILNGHCVHCLRIKRLADPVLCNAVCPWLLTNVACSWQLPFPLLSKLGRWMPTSLRWEVSTPPRGCFSGPVGNPATLIGWAGEEKLERKEQVQVTLEENSWLRNPSALCSAHDTLAASVIISLIYALLTHLPLMRARAVSMTFWSLQLLTGSIPINLTTQYTTCFSLPPLPARVQCSGPWVPQNSGVMVGLQVSPLLYNCSLWWSQEEEKG